MSTPASPSAEPVLLLAEDDRDSVFLFERIFKQVCPKWKFVAMPDGLAAVNYMEEKGLPQVLVTDLNMPRMSGYELITWVRSRADDHHLPVVVTSSLLDQAVQQECTALGADELIPKGSSIESLKNVLRKLTSLARPEKA